MCCCYSPPYTAPTDRASLVLDVAQVRLELADLAEFLLRILGRDGGGHNDIVSDVPVNGGRDALLVGSLQGVDHTENLGGVTAGRRRVEHDQADLLGGVNNEDRADGESNALLREVVQILLGDHIVEEGDLAVSVGDDRELHGGVGHLVDIVHPLIVRTEVVGTLQIPSVMVSFRRVDMDLGWNGL